MKKLMLILGLVLAGCATNPNKATKLDLAIEHAEKAGADITIGVKDGEMVAQRKVLISEELRRIQNDAYELEAKVYGGERYNDNNGQYGVLRTCKAKQGQVTGELTPMPEKRAYVIPEDDYKIGMDDMQRLAGIHREYLKERLDRFQQYRQVLQERSDEYQNRIEICNLQKLAVK